MVIQNTLKFRIMHYLKILVANHLLFPYGLNELKYKRIPKDKTPLNLLCGMEMVARRKNQCTINLHNHKRNFKKIALHI